MSKRSHRKEKQAVAPAANQRTIIIISLLACLLGAGTIIAQRGAPGPKPLASSQGTSRQKDTVTAAGFQASGPAKEYIYAGGRLIATEEPSSSGGCSYTLSPTSQSFTSSGGSGGVTVTAGTGCAWTATSNAAWITITSGATGSGNGTVQYSVAANTGSARNSTMTIAGQSFTVSQSAPGCSPSISPTSQSFLSSGGAGSISVTAGAGCGWTATSNASWLTITSGGSGSGSGTVQYSVASNTGAARNGTMTAAGQTFTASQAGASGSSNSNHSMALNGSGQYVSVADSNSLDITSAITVEAWIKTSTSIQQGIIEKYSPNASGNNGGFALRIEAGKVVFYTLQNAAIGDLVTGATTVSNGAWHHVAGVFTGGQLQVYVDGSLDASKSSTFAPVAGTTSLKIGARGDDAAWTFNGLIDEARVSPLALYTGSFTPNSNPLATSSTRGLWKFDGEMASDSTENCNTGTRIGGGTYSTDTPGDPSWAGHSISLNAAGAYVNVPNSTSLNITGSITVEAWVWIDPNSTATQMGIVERYSPQGAGSFNGGYALRVEGGALTFYTLQNAAEGDVVTGTVVPKGIWCHVAGVFDGSQLRVYLNGAAVGSKSSTFAPVTGTSSTKIGARGDDAAFTFQGKIDEARVSASALYSGATITPQAHPGIGASTRGLWKFDSQTAADYSGNCNKGTRVGSTSYSTSVP